MTGFHQHCGSVDLDFRWATAQSCKVHQLSGKRKISGLNLVDKLRFSFVHVDCETNIPSGKRLHNYGKSPFLMGKITINGHFQSQTVSLPEGTL